MSSVNVYVIEDSRILLNRRANTGWKDGFLCAPGGHVEPGETPSVAAIREIKEELGVDINPGDLEFICVASRKTSPNEYVAFEFVVRDKNYEVKNAEPGKCSELVWVEQSNLPEDVIDAFRDIIQRSIIGDEKYLELDY